MPDMETDKNSPIYKRTFYNGSIYVVENINFYLRRQDPNGVYGLQYTYGESKGRSNFDINGVSKLLTNIDYKTEDDFSICKL